MSTAFQKKYLCVIVILLVGSTLAGYLYDNLYPSNQVVSSNFPDIGFIKSLPPYFLFLFIFFNNSIKAILAIYLGVILGLFPIYFITVNGFFIGIFFDSVFRKEGLAFFLAGILPHGIFEISAIVLASGYGLWLGRLYYRKWVKKEKIETKAALRYCWQNYYKIILPLLFMAALIETYLTPIVMKRFS